MSVPSLEAHESVGGRTQSALGLGCSDKSEIPRGNDRHKIQSDICRRGTVGNTYLALIRYIVRRQIVFLCRYGVRKESPDIRSVGQQLCPLFDTRSIAVLAVRRTEPPCKRRCDEHHKSKQPQHCRAGEHKSNAEQDRRHHTDGIVGQLPAVSVALGSGCPLEHTPMRNKRSPQRTNSGITRARRLICERAHRIDHPAQLKHDRTAYSSRAYRNCAAVCKSGRQARHSAEQRYYERKDSIREGERNNKHCCSAAHKGRQDDKN